MLLSVIWRHTFARYDSGPFNPDALIRQHRDILLHGLVAPACRRGRTAEKEIIMTALRIATVFAALVAAGRLRPAGQGRHGKAMSKPNTPMSRRSRPGASSRSTSSAATRCRPARRCSRSRNDSERAARDQAAAELAQAESDLADLQKGERPEDLAIIQAQLDKARASLALSVPRLQRREKMVKGSIIGEEELDEAKSQILSDRGNIAEYEARLVEAQPARAHRQDRRGGKAGRGAPSRARRCRVAPVAAAGEGAGRGARRGRVLPRRRDRERRRTVSSAC